MTRVRCWPHGVAKGGTIHTDTEEFGTRVSELLQMIVATKEYIYA